METDNPFASGAEPPSLSLAGGRRVDLMVALRDGTGHALRHPLALFGAAVLAFVVYLVSVCTCVGWVATAPFLLRGLNRFMLSVVDGQPDFGAFTEGVNGDPLRVFLNGWGVLLVLFLLILPSMGLSFALEYAKGAGLIGPWVALGLGNVVGLAWGAVIVPLSYASYLWADRDLGVMDAYKEAFEAFRPSWLPLIGLLVAMQLVMLPPTLLGPYIQGLVETVQAHPEALDALAPMFGATALMYLWFGAALMLSMCWTITAYRQVIPPASDEGPAEA